jgi:hypothetical protein
MDIVLCRDPVRARTPHDWRARKNFGVGLAHKDGISTKKYEDERMTTTNALLLPIICGGKVRGMCAV